MYPTLQHGSRHAKGTLCYRVLGLTKRTFVEGQKTKICLRETAPGSVPFGIYIYIYTYIYIYIHMEVAAQARLAAALVLAGGPSIDVSQLRSWLVEGDPETIFQPQCDGTLNPFWHFLFGFDQDARLAGWMFLFLVPCSFTGTSGLPYTPLFHVGWYLLGCLFGHKRAFAGLGFLCVQQTSGGSIHPLGVWI